MNKIKYVLAVVIFATSVCRAGVVETGFHWNDPSGKEHTEFMLAGSLSLCGWLHLLTIRDTHGKQAVTRKQAIIGTAITGMSIGLAKELSDSRRGGTGFSMNDLYHDGIGVLAGLSPFILTYRF